MRDTRHTLQVLDRLEPPDLWTDITEGNRRASESFEIPTRIRPTHQRFVAGAVALALVAAATFLVWTAFRPRATIPGGSSTASTTKHTVVVRDLIGLRQEIAERQIEVSGLTVGSVSRRYDPEWPQGVVIDQDPPPGTTVSGSASVSLVVSAGNRSLTGVFVPNVIGLDVVDAADLMDAAGFVTQVEIRPDSTVAAGVVSATDPPPGTRADKGTYVTLFISAGPEQ